jgi:hypothetical protein
LIDEITGSDEKVSKKRETVLDRSRRHGSNEPGIMGRRPE